MPFSDLTLTTLDDKPGFFRVENDVHYTYFDDIGNKHKYVVGKGTITDLASIPPILRGVLSQVGRSRKPAVFHDHMYSNKWQTRKYCDQMFKKMLIERGMSKFGAWLYYQGVRKFGWTRGSW